MCRYELGRYLAAFAGLTVSAPLFGQFGSSFEPPVYTGSPAGSSVVGQDGWYTPVIDGVVSLDGRVYTHANESLALPDHPGGGSLFIGGTGAGMGTRAQRDVDFTTEQIWSFNFDLALRPGLLLLGSVSTQPTTARRFSSSFVDQPGSFWGTYGVVYDANGTFLAEQSPGPAFDQLLYDRWYRQTTRWNAATNQIEDVSVTDLTTMVTISADVRPLGWYAAGGENSSLPLPTAIRLFVGNSSQNRMGWDNLSLIPEPSGAALFAGVFIASVSMRRKF